MATHDKQSRSNLSENYSDILRLALRPRAAAKTLGISESTLRKLTKACGIPHLKVGHVVLYPVTSLEYWLHESVIKGAKNVG